MRVNRFAPTTIGALCGLLLAAPLARAAQHQHMPPPASHPGMQPVMPEKVEKGEKAIKVGKKGDVKFDAETLVGDLRLKPGRYQIQHRTDGPDHFVHAASVHTWSTLVPCHAKQRRRQIRRRRRLFQQPFRFGCRGAEIARGLALRSVQQESLPGGCVRRAGSLAPLRAVGKHEGQLT